MEGIVLQTTGSWYLVRTDQGSHQCRLPGRFKQEENKTTNPIAVGDKVAVAIDTTTGDMVIEAIHPRSNYIVRQSPRQKHYKHIIAANIDRALLIVTVSQPRTSLGFVDRFLVAAESYHIPVTILVNKIDALRKKDERVLDEILDIYPALGYPVITASAEQRIGLEEVSALLRDRTTLVAGHSGVGKSTLVNALNPELSIRTKKISSKWEKGMHTTTFATMYEVFPGSYIIDTPGIKEFFVIEIQPEELSGYFPEMRERVGGCQYNNCLHYNEPGCAIKTAVEQGEIAYSRFENYLNILENIRSVNYWERL
jgi:ribosome biogenesis GTPase / thiamine phosphate phosphatase